MSGEEAGTTPEQSDGQSGSRVFFVLAIAVALPFAVGYLLGSPGAMALVPYRRDYENTWSRARRRLFGRSDIEGTAGRAAR